MLTSTARALLALLLLGASLAAQVRRLEQDPALDNLVHAPDTPTCELGELGRVTRFGTGPRAMVLIAGAGFGGSVFASLTEAFGDAFTLHAVTLPGFDGTRPPPMPLAGTSYGEQTWTLGARRGVERLIREQGLERPVLLAHWATAPQVALGLALEHPELLGGLVLVSPIGAYDAGQLPAELPLERRVAVVDDSLAPAWFKTVTRDTWDDNNFYPHDYARHPVRALQLWRQAADAELPVWVRYLCEGWAQDLRPRLSELRVPTLILKPGFDADLPVEEGRDYLRAFCHDSWEGVAASSSVIEEQTIADTRVFIMDDQPAALAAALHAFVDREDVRGEG